MRDVLLAVHRGLHGVGSSIAKLCVLALVAVLFFVPVFAMLLASVFGAVWLGGITGRPDLVWVIAFFVIMGLIGSYIAPYIQPQITAAIRALLAEPRSAQQKGDSEPSLK